eukprot:3227530-Rhodomonas_salina.1
MTIPGVPKYIYIRGFIRRSANWSSWVAYSATKVLVLKSVLPYCKNFPGQCSTRVSGYEFLPGGNIGTYGPMQVHNSAVP